MLQHRHGHMRVYERKNKRFAKNCVVEEDRFDGGSDMMWGTTSYNKRTPLVLVPDNCIATITHRERFLNTRTPDRTQHVQVLSIFFLTTTSLCYHGHPDHRIWIPWIFSGIGLINVCACINQPANSSANQAGTTRIMAKNTQGPNLTFNSINAETTKGGHTRY